MNEIVQHLTARRIISARRRGSSRPIVVETEAGIRLVKLRGSAQGVGPLVAEIIVANLAEQLGLLVPPRSLITLPKGIPTEDWDDELDDLLAASVGLNLGFDYLDGAREISGDEAQAFPPKLRSAILWLDRLVLNLDRTKRNPNLLQWADETWLIDHGAALGFQYRWERITDESPRESWAPPEAHLFDSTVTENELRAADATYAPILTRPVLEQAVSQVPDDFWISPKHGGTSVLKPIDLSPRRAPYVTFLWKRLQPPRQFLNHHKSQPAQQRGRHPDWLTKLFQNRS